MRINREKLLRELQMAQYGLASREMIQQSTCFIFADERVYSFNDEVLCSCPSSLTNMKGAVPAKPLLEILNKLPEEIIVVVQDDGKLKIKGKGKQTTLRLEEEIQLHIDSVEKPSKWEKLPSSFNDAIEVVQKCAGNDENTLLVCLHIHPDWIEASDDYQACKYKLKTGVDVPILVKRDSVKAVPSLGMTHISQTKSWLHFKNADGLILSCRKYMDEFPDTSSLFEIDGKRVTLPKGLGDTIERAQIFSSEKANDDDQIIVEIREGKMYIKGVGETGSHYEAKKISYSGKAIQFLIPPLLFADISGRHNECIISENNRLKISGSNWEYMTTLGLCDNKESA